MIILNLNVHKFDGGSEKLGNCLEFFCKYVAEKKPDIVVLQECKNVKALKEKLVNDYIVIYPCEFDVDSENGYSITVMFVKKDRWKLVEKPSHLEVREYRWVEIEDNQYSILGVHIPAEKSRKNYSGILKKLRNGEKISKGEMKKLAEITDPVKSLEYGLTELKALDSARMLDSLLINSLNRMEENKKVIVIGDMNANFKRDYCNVNSDRLNLLKHLYAGGRYIFDAWERCIKHEKAYIIGKDSKAVLCSDENKFTFENKTHIDYAFYSSDIKINKMVIDDTTLQFTDHSALLLYIYD